MDLSNKQWAIIEPLIPVPPRRPDGRGRPWADNRKLLGGMLWILRTGAQWEDLPRRYGTRATCHRRFQQWVSTGVFERILSALADDLLERGGMDLSECFVDATFVSAKKGEVPSVQPGAGRDARSWQWQTALVFLSPSTFELLHRRRSPLLNRYSSTASSALCPSD